MSKQLSFGDYSIALEPRLRMQEIPAADRPRERLQHVGAEALSTAELVAILLKTGTREMNALSLAHALLVRFENLQGLMRATMREMSALKGIGQSKSLTLLAAFELGRRSMKFDPIETVKVTAPASAANYLMADMMNLEQEHLRVVLLNTRNEILDAPTVYKGSLNTSVIRIGELFRPAIKANAAAIIIAHNHPSGDPSPSPEDINVTRQIVKAGKLIDISVLDHIVIGHNRFVSLKELQLGFD
jgi:DNA repair protein RadC